MNRKENVMIGISSGISTQYSPCSRPRFRQKLIELEVKLDLDPLFTIYYERKSPKIGILIEEEQHGQNKDQSN